MYHTLILAGALGRDPEMRYTPSGQAVTNFSLAVNRVYNRSDGETVKETLWFRVAAWGKLAEVANQYLHKGSKVLVEGRLVADPNTGGPRTFTRNDGTPGAAFEVTASTIKFLSPKSDGQPHEETSEAVEEELPF